MQHTKYKFVRKRHACSGVCRRIRLFEQDIYANVYVDQYNALKRFSDYLTEHEEEYEALQARKRDLMTVKDGYFVLLSNTETTPREMLWLYFGRTDIEVVFKTGKEYLELLPLSKWTEATVRGKILDDIVSMIAPCTLSVSEVLGKCQSPMCFRGSFLVS